MAKFLTQARVRRILGDKLAIRVGSHADSGAAYALGDFFDTPFAAVPTLDKVELDRPSDDLDERWQKLLFDTLLFVGNHKDSPGCTLFLLGNVGPPVSVIERYDLPTSLIMFFRGEARTFTKTIMSPGAQVLSRVPLPTSFGNTGAVNTWARFAFAWVKAKIDSAPP